MQISIIDYVILKCILCCPCDNAKSVVKQTVASCVICVRDGQTFWMVQPKWALKFDRGTAAGNQVDCIGTSPYLIFALLPLAGLSWELVYSGPAKEHVCDGLKPGCSYQTRIYCLSEGGQSPVSHSALAHVHGPVSLATRIQKLWRSVVWFFFFFCWSQLMNWQNYKLLPSERAHQRLPGSVHPAHKAQAVLRACIPRCDGDRDHILRSHWWILHE